MRFSICSKCIYFLLSAQVNRLGAGECAQLPQNFMTNSINLILIKHRGVTQTGTEGRGDEDTERVREMCISLSAPWGEDTALVSERIQ